jgi:hypothetical protein
VQWHAVQAEPLIDQPPDAHLVMISKPSHGGVSDSDRARRIAVSFRTICYAFRDIL